MKKLFLFLLLGLLAISLVGCGLTDLIDDIVDEYQDDENQDDDNDSDNHEGGNQDDEEEIKFNLPNEFDIEYTLETKTTNTDGETSTSLITTHFALCEEGALMNIDGGLDVLYVFDGDIAYMCGYDEENDRYISSYYVTQSVNDAKESIYAMLETFQGIGANYDMDKKGTDTILGRKCDFYKIKEVGGVTNSYFEIYRDQETNLCLKSYGKTIASYAGVSATSEYTHTVTKFVTKDVKLPDHPSFAKSVTDAYITSDGDNKAEEVYVGQMCFINVIFDSENSIGTVTASCEDANAEFTTLLSYNVVTFKAAGDYTIKINGVGEEFIFNVTVIDYE